MTSRDFCYWLQGYLEISTAQEKTQPAVSLLPEQVQCIQKHLALVFTHEIDPSQGDASHQEKLNKIHQIGGVDPKTGAVYRC